MPKGFFTVSPVDDASKDSVNRLVVEIQTAFDLLNSRLAQVEATDGFTFTPDGHIDMSGRRILNGGDAVNDSDVPSQGQLVQQGLFRRARHDFHETNFPIHANRGVKVPIGGTPGFAVSFDEVNGRILAILNSQASFTGTATFAGSVSYTQTTPAAIAANTNDYNPGTGTAFRISATAPFNITGFANGVDGRLLLLFNVGANAITITNEDVLSVAGNRVHSSTAAAIVCAADAALLLWYDITTLRWRDAAKR